MDQQKKNPTDISTDSWAAYYNRASTWGPSAPLLRAIDEFQKQGIKLRKLSAVDLGCGEGRDTAELLKRGFHVIAIDSEAEALKRVSNRHDILSNDKKRLQTVIARFEQAEWGKVELVNANLSLHLCPREYLPVLWQKITKSLRRGGRFAGTLVGRKDRRCEEATRLSQRELDELFLDSFDVEHLGESEERIQRLNGTHYYTHMFSVVARKR
jgi:SAM-dependent methyltransferase